MANPGTNISDMTAGIKSVLDFKDALVDQDIRLLESRLNKRMDEVKSDLNERMDAIEKRLDERISRLQRNLIAFISIGLTIATLVIKYL